MSLAEIIAEIETAGLGVPHVDGISGIAAIDEASFRPPAIFVAQTAETAANNSRVNAIRQVITVSFSVIVVIAAAARRHGVRQEQIDHLTDGIKSALIGFLPTGATQAVSYRGGRLLRAVDGRISWQMDFRFETVWSKP